MVRTTATKDLMFTRRQRSDAQTRGDALQCRSRAGSATVDA